MSNPTQVVGSQTAEGHANSHGYEVAIFGEDGVKSALQSLDVPVSAVQFDGSTVPGRLTVPVAPQLFDQDFQEGTYKLGIRPYSDVRDDAEWRLEPGTVHLKPGPSPVTDVGVQ